MPQTEIANHLGMSTEHLNRVLRELRESGIVTVKDKAVTIDGMARLAKLAAPLQDIYERNVPISDSSSGTGWRY